MVRGARWATVHLVTKSQTQLNTHRTSSRKYGLQHVGSTRTQSHFSIVLLQHWWVHTYCDLRLNPALGKNHETSPGDQYSSSMLLTSSMTLVFSPFRWDSSSWLHFRCAVVNQRNLLRTMFHASCLLLSPVSKYTVLDIGCQLEYKPITRYK